MIRQTLTLLPLLAALSSAQLITNGNSQLPSCASTCTLLSQAAQACGGTTSSNQAIWSCFCQSAYLTTLYSSPSGICDATCTNPTDNQQVMTWFTSNCGTDYGASEHADSGTTVVVLTSTSTSAPVAAPTGSTAAVPTTTASGGYVDPDAQPSSDGKSWWSAHYKWVIMLIVLFVCLILLAILATWLKRRHDRKADQIKEGFNTGITTRSTPMAAALPPTDGTADSTYMSGGASTSQMMSGAAGMEGLSGSGRNSPARTREAFMPYGFQYTRSESRLGSRVDDIGGRKSPLARGGTPVGELEKEVGMANVDGAPRPKKSRRVLVRERSVEGPGSPVDKEMR
ncbi:hypothetical protein LTS10_012117 [Elasticomyces elasticus]|nr:hypothetical protein LTS10_012117 [Elasticomyces elasticus]